jgi:1-acyl-sn-glycerol-3-phosphate acyltransferase
MLRKVLLFGFGIVGMIALFPLALLMLPWPTKRWRRTVAHLYADLWSRGCLRVAGVRLVIEGREHLATCPAVLTFNHTSMVDFFVNAVVAPFGTLVFGKRELVRVPFLGWMWWLGGHPMINRHEPGQWEVVLKEVEDSLEGGSYRCIIAPEGTRSRDGTLLPFKKGAFRMALHTRAPVVPVVLIGVADVYDSEAGRFRPGTVTARVLPPVPTDDWARKSLGSHMNSVRDAYQRELVA